MKSTASSSSSRPSSGGAVAPSGLRNRSSGARPGAQGPSAPKNNQNALGLAFYGDDSAGTLKLGPIPILSLSFAYIVLVIMLHALAKFTR
mmetsp:Transcript_16253/g.25258  ORF Transcript_16253/g.25258 Transcript_16253/m.25258 type:complete len:90 (-) Transcript_16253:62-331(-)